MKGAKHTFVGNFFEQVAHHILGGDLTRNDDGDLNLWQSGITVEVKSSGHLSSYGFRLSVGQIEFYNALRNFPFDHAWYVFFSYRNKSQKVEDGRRATELSHHNDPLSINRYLAESVLWCTVVDFSIIAGCETTLPHSTKSVMGHRGLETVDLKTAFVHNLANGGFVSCLNTIGLDSANYVKVGGQISTELQPDLFNTHKVSFPITAIMLKAQSPNFQKMLRKRGFPLSQKVD